MKNQNKQKVVVTPEMEYTMRNMYRSYTPISEIAEEFGVSEGVVRYHGCGYDLGLLPEERNYNNIDEDTIIEILALYECGESIAELSRKFNVSVQTIYRYLNKADSILPENNIIEDLYNKFEEAVSKKFSRNHYNNY